MDTLTRPETADTTITPDVMPQNTFRSFASDNHAGVHPEVMAALTEANTHHAVAYGEDPWSARAKAAFQRHFGPNIEVFYVFNGTAANILSLHALSQRFHSILCTEHAHIHTDECGAPEALIGCKLLAQSAPQGKLTPTQIEATIGVRGTVHHSQPQVISITQSTELGTVYTMDELRAIGNTAKRLGFKVHMDGARLANAAAALNVSLKDMTDAARVDILSMGGTKNGLMATDAVVCLTDDGKETLPYFRKQTMQLCSKMRYLAAQWIALLEGDLWHRNAAHANTMAQQLAQAIGNIPELTLNQAVDANALFVEIPRAWVAPLQEHYYFYVWRDTPADSTVEVRLMTSFDTTQQDIDGFIDTLKRVTA